jgi:hypothetical protein
VIKNIGMKTSQTNRLLISNKMYVVIFICEGLAEFCCQYTTTSEGRVANDGYVHIDDLKVDH